MSPRGANYSLSVSKEREYFAADRRQMLKYVPKSAKRTLEFGCGFGGFSSLLKAERGVEAWAVEIDPAAAQEAAKKLDRVICADAATGLEDLPDGHFDCIIFLDILEHLADPYSLLSAISRKLAPQGCVVASIPNIRYYTALKGLAVHGNWDYADHGILDITHLRFFTFRSIGKMFDKLDYDVLELEGINPTSSWNYKILNALLLNWLWDVRYKHFAVVARPRTGRL